MPIVKNKLIAFYAIDECLRNTMNNYPTKEEFRTKCEDSIFGTEHNQYICESSIEKYLYELRNEYDAPIKYCKINKGYHYSEPFILDLTPDRRYKNIIIEILHELSFRPDIGIQRIIKKYL